MNTTYEEYKNWLKDVPIDPNVERKYKAALELLAPRRILEDRLAAQGNLLSGIDNKSVKRKGLFKEFYYFAFSNFSCMFINPNNFFQFEFQLF